MNEFSPEMYDQMLGGDAYDGLATFDPNSRFAKGTSQAASYQNKGKDLKLDAVITLRIKNTSSSPARCELFNTIKSLSKVPNFALFPTIKPLTVELLANRVATQLTDGSITSLPTAYNVDGNLLKGTATFNEAGNLIITQNFVGAPNTVEISCQQMPYKQLIDNLGTMIINIRQWKLQTSSENQIKNAFQLYYYGDLGVVTNDSFEPSEFFQPENQQTKLINITRQAWIDKNTAVFIDLEPNEDMQITLNVSAYKDNALLGFKK